MFETAELCDTHGEQVRVLDAGLRHFGGNTRFHGQVATLKVPADFLLVKQTLASAGRNRVLVVDGGAARDHALLGDRLTEMAIGNDWAGVVINGCIRDSAVIRKLQIGVLALGTCPRRPAMSGTGETDVPVTVGSVEIQPGDWLYADSDGAIVSSLPLPLKA